LTFMKLGPDITMCIMINLVCSVIKSITAIYVFILQTYNVT